VKAIRGVLQVLLAAPLVLAAVPPASGQQQPLADNFKDGTEVSWVIVPVTVRDERGRLVPDLDRALFHLLVDGLEFPISSFWQEGDLPIALTFVLDTSGSMGVRRLGKAREVILEFVRQLRPDDQVCLITFGAGEVKRRLRFGNDPALLPRILEPLVGFGTTALYDMVSAMGQVMEGAKHVRRAALLFTDGVDTASALGAAEALTIAEGLADPIYVFGIEPPPPQPGAAVSYEDVLRSFAAASGGAFIRVEDVERLPELGASLRRELTQRYIISFEPSGKGMAKRRTVDVKVDGPYQVATRQGYTGTLP